MRHFTRLYLALGETTSSSRKIALLVEYFRAAPAEDAALALSYLLGQRPRRPVKTTDLRAWVSEASGVPGWLLDACFESVGDLGETLALLLPDDAASADGPTLSGLVRDGITGLVGRSPDEVRRRVEAMWHRLGSDERLVYHKLIGGAFRIGVAKGLVLRAISELTGVELAVITHRLSGSFAPSAAAWNALLAGEASDEADARPYPFCLASPWNEDPAALGAVGDFLIERKFDGIRAQLFARATPALWSRGEERIDASFPELMALARRIPPGAVLDGEVLLVEGDRILPFAQLQSRINAKRGAWQADRGLFDLERVAFMAYDLLELDGRDLRAAPLSERRRALEALVGGVADDTLRLSPEVRPATWEEAARERDRSRPLGVEGLMLKRRDAAYGVGRQRGSGWWKWKVDPHTVDAVLVAAEPGHGRRANLLTDYTFAVWRGDELVPVAKAYSGLTQEEIARLDKLLRADTLEKRGPVRLVRPTHVFEIGFEGLQRSTRHKSGIAVRFPRILRWRTDKRPADADRVDALEELLRQQQ